MHCENSCFFSTEVFYVQRISYTTVRNIRLPKLFAFKGLAERLASLYRQFSLSQSSRRPSMYRPSLLRLLALPGFVHRRMSELHFQRIRSMMLSLLEPHTGEQVSRTRQRVRFAQDVEALWYLRQDLVLVLTEFEGGEAARTQTMKVNDFFQGRLPSTMRPRLHRRLDLGQH